MAPGFARTASQAVRRAAGTFAATRYPAGYHGDYQGDAGFFEGWYVKLVSADRSARLALIPGIFKAGARGARGEQAQDEAFVQVLNGMTGESWYETFPASQFRADPRVFDVTLGGSPGGDGDAIGDVPLAGAAVSTPVQRFDERGLSVNLDGPRLSGSLRYTSPLDPWPVTMSEPGVMGRYAWVPVMECYHGLVSFGHGLEGTLTLGEKQLDFTGGRGYIEKDWGRAFPQGYVWMQTHHFDTPGVSLSASIATIPWGRSSFRGFIVGLRFANAAQDTLHKFATYTGARTTVLEIDDASVRWEMVATSGDRLRLRAERRRGGLLHAPVRTQMHRRVEETLDARVHVELVAADGTELFAGTGEAAGLEVHGDLERLVALSGRRSR